MTTLKNLSEKTPLIQIVEDSLTQAKKLERLLKENGYEVSIASNGKLGLEMAKKAVPTVIITDVMMPEMDGYEMCRKVKDDPNLSAIPVVLLTSLSDPGDVIKGLQSGADNFLTKPYDDDHLLRRLQHVLGNLELRRSGQAQMSVEVYFGGQYHKLTADRIQIVDLLLSTFEAAVMQNSQLQKLSGDYRNALDDVKRVQANFQTIMETTGDSIVVVGGDGTVHYMNPAAELLFEKTNSELMGKPFPYSVEEEGDREISLTTSKGDVYVDMRVVGSNWNGELVRLATLRDISETVCLRSRLEVEAVTDPLTELYNRRGFIAMGEKALKIADNNNIDSVCIFADLDNFKMVNDNFGHDEGDRVLQETAQVLNDTFRDSDIIGRVGGDEFTVIFLLDFNKDQDYESVVRSRLENNLKLKNNEPNRCPYKLAMSLGFEFRKHGSGTTLSEFMIKADKKMYQEKEAKKNKKT